MSESKLQNKTILLVLQIYLTVLAVSLILSYFLVISPLKEDAVENYNAQNKYILDEVDSVLGAVKEYTNYIAYSEDFMDKLSAYLRQPDDALVRFELETLLYNDRNLKQGIQDVVLDIEGYDKVTSILELEAEEQELLNSEWYARIRKKSYSGGFSKGLTIIQNENPVKLLAYSKSYRMKNKKFTLTVFLRYEDFFGRIMSHYHSEFEEQYWTTLDGQALFEEEELGIHELRKKFDKDEKHVQKNSKGVLLTSNLGNSSYRSLAFISWYSVFEKIRGTTLIVLSMAIILLIGTLLIVVYIVKRVTRPVHQLTEAMDQVITENFAVKLPVESDDEIGYLSQTFNSMSEELQNYFSQLVKKMEEEQEMKFGLLISQINPHFVCNTLNTIKYLAKQGRTRDVEVVSAALANILRDRLRIKNFQIYDTVVQETDTVKQYLTIQEYRYGGEVEVLWDIEEEVKGLKIPKNIIQPLVENALFHGLANEEDGSIRGTITIQVEKTDALYIRVTDDGCGMSQQKIHRIMSGQAKGEQERKGHEIGIDNIRERLEILYGDEADFFIRSEPGEWTEMEIVIWQDLNKV